jgi:DNA-binding HxlR family transcriptional regulator
MSEAARSTCPIGLSLDAFGDRWTLLILRDLMFTEKRHFRELLNSEEGIASNVLADRLRRLVEIGVLTRNEDPAHKRKAIYSLTEKGIELMPILVEIGKWGARHFAAAEWPQEAVALAEGGARSLRSAQRRLEKIHLAQAA